MDTTITLGAFDTFEEASEMLNDFAEICNKYNTVSELYIGDLKEGGFVVYMTSYKLKKRQVEEEKLAVVTG